jgi:hypothetical protein
LGTVNPYGDRLVVPEVLTTPGVKIKQIQPLRTSLAVLLEDGRLYLLSDLEGSISKEYLHDWLRYYNNTYPESGAYLEGVERIEVENYDQMTVNTYGNDRVLAFVHLANGGMDVIGPNSVLLNNTNWEQNKDTSRNNRVMAYASSKYGASMVMESGEVLMFGMADGDDPNVIQDYARERVESGKVTSIAATDESFAYLLEDGNVVLNSQTSVDTWFGNNDIGFLEGANGYGIDLSDVSAIFGVDEGWVIQYRTTNFVKFYYPSEDGESGGNIDFSESDYTDYYNDHWTQPDGVICSKGFCMEQVTSRSKNGRQDGRLACAQTTDNGLTMRFYVNSEAAKKKSSYTLTGKPGGKHG